MKILSPSEQTRKNLDDWWANQTEYKKISFTINLNSLASQEACEAELWEFIQKMEQEKKNGTWEAKLVPLGLFKL